jgi:hypothetical protein
MNNYVSEQVLPYVYMCIHKYSNEFYIGSRWANKIPSHLDFPKYKTSSKKIKSSFDDFTWFIVAEFFNAGDAWDYEQQLIKENWDNDKLLNCYFRINGKSQFRNKGGYNLSETTKNKMKKPKNKLSVEQSVRTKRENGVYQNMGGWKWSEESKRRGSVAQFIKNKKHPMTNEAKTNLSNYNKNHGIKPPIIECSCVKCKKIYRINNIKKHFDHCVDQ